MSDAKPGENSSRYKASWQQWDNAWALNLPQETRVAFLTEATGATFVWSNGADEVKNGDLVEMGRVIERLLLEAGNALTVKHVKWWEHHGQSALQWDMVHVATGSRLVSGFSHGSYDEEGRLLSVTDFY